MAVGYNLNHLQVAPKGASPTFIDVPGSVSWEPSITADSEDVKADGQTYVTVYSAPVGEGDMTWIDFRPDVLATINGGEVSTSGTGPTEITRYEQKGSFTPVPFIIADWVPNQDKNHDSAVAGVRTTVPNATAEPASRSSGQESTQEWTASTKFTPDANDVLIIYEALASEPEFTTGVMSVNLTAPAP